MQSVRDDDIAAGAFSLSCGDLHAVQFVIVEPQNRVRSLVIVVEIAPAFVVFEPGDLIIVGVALGMSDRDGRADRGAQEIEDDEYN